MINLHPSLLPQYRGASPIPYTILNGDTRSGVSVIEVADSMDHGAVYLQRECPIPHRPTRTQLFRGSWRIWCRLYFGNVGQF
eukprot:UN04285